MELLYLIRENGVFVFYRNSKARNKLWFFHIFYVIGSLPKYLEQVKALVWTTRNKQALLDNDRRRAE